jgi:hypothetical protein
VEQGHALQAKQIRQRVLIDHPHMLGASRPRASPGDGSTAEELAELRRQHADLQANKKVLIRSADG